MAFKDSFESLWAASSVHYDNALQFLKTLADQNSTAVTTENTTLVESQIGRSNLPELSTMPFSIDLQTVFSFLFVAVLLVAAYAFTNRCLPARDHERRFRLLFFWHLIDALVHFTMEGTFLFHCFFSYAAISPSQNREPVFLGDKDHVYGATYSTWPSAQLWQEYAKADSRWGGADANIISLELITVLFGGTAAAIICTWIYQVSTGRSSKGSVGEKRGKMWFTMIALATAELYGGIMTFMPEWLTGSQSLSGNWFHVVVYLAFFNLVWVFIPAWVLYEAWKECTTVFYRHGKDSSSRKMTGK
ncbi:EBP-domain-containing protein [Aspergillus sclerotioniger CBS 115572]|uniref:EBP-domain-containing protein n=1 Tax=Aspergillus sclerotioniger CBS 115572 TaxID=1450535 RepID=A0A317WXC7_9EURO|nr:EBP-domain-containing protein [Aspergillus sclerotioniger CBS 115572]PWY89448.1 EBP-domain-containing protein [Aspergillus sclerotioniger CBS 115572]